MQGTVEQLQAALDAALGDRITARVLDRGQLTVEVRPEDLIAACSRLREDPALAFTTLIDLVGIDYQGYDGWEGARYAVSYNLLSIVHNFRVRVRVFAASEDFPGVDSVIGVWPRPTGTSARRSTCTASSSAGTRTCGASSPTTASWGTRSARTSR
jgi:NADH-quinone oxidoreductase subunit C